MFTIDQNLPGQINKLNLSVITAIKHRVNHGINGGNLSACLCSRCRNRHTKRGSGILGVGVKLFLQIMTGIIHRQDKTAGKQQNQQQRQIESQFTQKSHGSILFCG